jgi:hypothetical protein
MAQILARTQTGARRMNTANNQNPRPFIATTYKGRPAIMDTQTRVFYTAKTHAAAQARAAELNKPAP